VHDIPQLIEKRGGKVGFVKSLEEHFEGGHNDHTNEVRFLVPPTHDQSSLTKLDFYSPRITFRIYTHFLVRHGRRKNV
jgi:hypothetical protein